MKLNQLADNYGAHKGRKRVGRGIGSGKGKTCGSGTKGQKSRTGVAIRGFEGGQQPIHRRLPKRGFNPLNRVEFQVINLGHIQKLIDSGKLSDLSNITIESLNAAGLISSVKKPVKLLAKGTISKAITINVSAASKTAIEQVKAAGGDVALVS